MPHRVDLGAPRVGADPVEVAGLAAPHRRREEFPGIDGNHSDVSQDRVGDGHIFLLNRGCINFRFTRL